VRESEEEYQENLGDVKDVNAVGKDIEMLKIISFLYGYGIVEHFVGVVKVFL